MKSVIYAIVHIVSGRLYVGSTSHCVSRWEEHRRRLNGATHHNAKLQNAWNKYGPDSFTFKVLEGCPVGRLVEREQHWMDATGCCERSKGFNIKPVAGRGRHSDETLAKLRKAGKARAGELRRQRIDQKWSNDTRAKMSASHLAMSSEKRKRINEGLLAYHRKLIVAKTAL